uniref:C-type lectin domain-containing protein n=1 Tax=Strix occidentalis caurina TaxID=311401 RepID=A0A8D0FTZ2_STROC
MPELPGNGHEGGGCRLCPPNWMLRGTKCFWVGDEQKAWSQSREDCATRGAELLVPGGPEELVKGPMASWGGDWGHGWTWLNGSRLAPGW